MALAQEMAQAAKPYIDRLIALNRLLNPIDRLVDKREQIQQFQGSSDRPIVKREQVQQFQSEVAEDIAEIEDLASDFGTEIDEGLFNDLQGEIAAVKKDCKLYSSARPPLPLTTQPRAREAATRKHRATCPYPRFNRFIYEGTVYQLHGKKPGADLYLRIR